MANITANELFEKIINEGSQIINKHDFSSFSNLKRISNVINNKAITNEIINNQTITNEIINNETTNETTTNETTTNETTTNETTTNETTTNEITTNETSPNETSPNETSIRAFINEKLRLSLTDDKNISDKEWIKCKINEGLITEYKIDKFIEFKMIGNGAFSMVYKAILKSTNNTYALKIIHNNEHTDKEIVNEIKHIISVGFHENIIKFYGVSKYKDQMDPNVVKNHPSNVLVHQQSLKLADFGLSRRISESSESRTTKEIFGVIPYIDPQCFLVKSTQNDTATLPLRLRDGLREEPIANTHHKYVAIYEKCWQGMQDDRPSIQEVAMELKDIIIQDIDVQDINIQDISKIENFDIFDINSFEKYLDSVFNKSINQENEQEAQETNKLKDDMSLFVDKLYMTFDKLFNEGRPVSDIIINSISKDGKTNEEVFNWLSTHDDIPKYICLLGLFYSWEIGTKNEDVDVFKLFLKAANSRDIIAQYFVGRCYETGWNIKKNMKQAIEWYTKASKGGCAIAECMLGEYFYKLNKYEQAFNLLKSAARKGNALAKNTLGICYQKGYGTNVDKAKGFKSFKEAAEMGLPASQYELGDCYEYGNGTKINLEKSLYWYKKASEKNLNYRIHVNRVKNRLNKQQKYVK
ncbi:2867_t:CDS:2 [Dentiscutata erythropus]|uniref:2867_t:CDS:1 n=1 Tax=Dentiscutata erythropus TaxID=1348616 RepID=A0A9N9GVB7_9GLOM|nr:2867_t:CDS:2 [Dentiscutata erythropus]